jgi:alkylated DNA repair dioxygenase AlkB
MNSDNSMNTSTITLTFCDVAENHVGMEKIGTLSDRGFSLKDLENIKEKIGGDIMEMKCPEDPNEVGYLLIIPGGIEKLGIDIDKLISEQLSLNPDKKAFMYGRVVNKHARWNLCFGDDGHEADYENKIGKVIKYDDVPNTKLLRSKIMELCSEENLACEANYYYDVNKCGIGWHSDKERKKVIGVRLGCSMPLAYRWYKNNKIVGSDFKYVLNNGDIYVMSEKAVGFDGKKRKIYTMRHAAGCEYIK